MLIKKDRLELKNVVKKELVGDLESCLIKIEDLKESLLQIGYYSTCPIVYRVLHQELESMKVEIYLQLNIMPANIQIEGITCLEQLVLEECLYSRYFPEEYNEEHVMNKIEQYAKKEKMQIEKPYFISWNIPNGNVIDVYVPVSEGNDAI